MTTNTPIAGAPYPGSSDQPNGPAQVAALAKAFDDKVLMRFATTAARDAAFSAYVSAGGTMQNGFRCVVAGAIHAYDGSNWYVRDGLIQVANQTARDALTKFSGMTVYQLDTAQQIVWTGTEWRLIRPQVFFNSGMASGNTAANDNWAGTSFAWVAGLGTKITIPADGVRRAVGITATCQVIDEGFIRIRVDYGSGSTVQFPNGAGIRHSGAGVEGTLVAAGYFDHLGSSTTTIYIEAAAAVANVPDFRVPTLTAVCY